MEVVAVSGSRNNDANFILDGKRMKVIGRRAGTTPVAISSGKGPSCKVRRASAVVFWRREILTTDWKEEF